MTFFKNIKEVFDASREEQDRGTLVEQVLIIAGMAVVAILVVTWIGNAIAGKAADTANCISGANTYTASASENACKQTTNSDKAKTTNDTSITNRFK
jgi:hypothetical protein